MSRFTTDLVRRRPPSTLAVFYDGAAPMIAASVARYRAAARRAAAPILWRDVGAHPEALTLFGLGHDDARGTLAVVDRLGRLRVGLDARIALWREVPGYRWRSHLLDLVGVAAVLERPMTPSRGAARHRAGRLPAAPGGIGRKGMFRAWLRPTGKALG